MALIDDNMAVIGDEIRYDALPNQALHQGDVDDAGRLPLSTMDDADLLGAISRNACSRATH